MVILFEITNLLIIQYLIKNKIENNS